MKILWVKANKILPVDTGGGIRSYNIIRSLAKQHQVTFLSYYGGSRDEAYECEVREQFDGAVACHIQVPDPDAQNPFDYLRRVRSPVPYAVAKYSGIEVKNILSNWLASGGFDVAVCDFLAASDNFPATLQTPSVLFQHNVESALWQRQAKWEPNLIKRLIYKFESAKMDRYERAALTRFHHVIAVSEHDRKLMSAMTDPARISVVPTGVDLARYREAAGVRPSTDSGVTEAEVPLVVFTGSMDWEANIDGVSWFCREVWPRVRSEVAGATFRIVGRNPGPAVKRLASGSVVVTGYVPSVIDHLRDSAVVVVPLRMGGGTRLKIYEAMAMGKAVVSTTIGAEGLDVHPGEDILLADDPAGFAAAIVRLLRDPSLRARHGQAAAALAARYDWPVIAARFAEVLERVVAFRPSCS